MSRHFRKLFKIIAALVGITLIGVGILAYQLGIDHNPEWGAQRIGIVSLGSLFLLLIAQDRIKEIWKSWTLKGARWLRKLPFVRAGRAVYKSGLEKLTKSRGIRRVGAGVVYLRRSSIIFWMDRNWILLTMVFCSIFVILSTVWIFSVGKMTIWPAGTNYYHLLADAFRHGQVHLRVEPGRQLLESPNPYDFRQRGKIPVLWDASFYNGKYYLYWGAVPGLLAAAVETIYPGEVQDPVLVLGFVWGTFLFSMLLLLRIWKQFNGILPRWSIFGGIMAAGVNLPLIWLLTRPSVYEVAIAGGQCFLLAGLFFAFIAFTRPKPVLWPLVLAAIFWTLAVGTRINLILMVAFLCLAITWRLVQVYRRDLRLVWGVLAAFFLPLLVGVAALAWYNYARFGSIFEFGHRYQLTGFALPADYGRVLSTDYIIPNLYTYFLRLPRFESAFPFVIVPAIKPTMWPFFISLPKDYSYIDPVASLLLIVPVLGFALLIAVWVLWLHLNGFSPAPTNLEPEANSLFKWLAATLAGTILTGVVFLFVYLASSLRYLVDITPVSIIMATLFMGWAWIKFANWRWRRRLFMIGWLGASFLAVAFGLLGGITGYNELFPKNNPALYEQLINWFR